MTAEELARATATNLHGEFATVVSTADSRRGGARRLTGAPARAWRRDDQPRTPPLHPPQ